MEQFTALRKMRISVVIPLYNKRTKILRTLNSVFDQTYLPEEIIVVNDGSTDGSEQIVVELNNPLIRMINQPNLGVSAARNLGIKEAKSEWIAFLDADDEWMPEYLKTIKLLSEKYSQCNILATGYFFQHYSGVQKGIVLRKLPFKGEDGILTNYFEVAVNSHPPFCSCSIIVKKESIKSIGGFPLKIHSGEDLLTWAKLACCNDIAYCINPQAIYYLNPAGNTDKRSSGPPEFDLVAIELNKLRNNCTKHPKKHLTQFIAHWHKMRASILIRMSNKKAQTLKEIKKSIITYPFNLKVYLLLCILILPKSIINKLFQIKNRLSYLNNS